MFSRAKIVMAISGGMLTDDVITKMTVCYGKSVHENAKTNVLILQKDHIDEHLTPLCARKRRPWPLSCRGDVLVLWKTWSEERESRQNTTKSKTCTLRLSQEWIPWNNQGAPQPCPAYPHRKVFARTSTESQWHLPLESVEECIQGQAMASRIHWSKFW